MSGKYRRRPITVSTNWVSLVLILTLSMYSLIPGYLLKYDSMNLVPSSRLNPVCWAMP